MHEYDITLKSVLRRLPGSLFAELTGFAFVRWHNVELPDVRSLRVDMLGETAEGKLGQIELQSTNDPDMALRMLEYATAVRRQFGHFPEQVVLYVGQAPLRMESRLAECGVTFECRMVDIREFDGDRLLANHLLEDNVIAILGHLRDERVAVRQILNRIAAGEPAGRATALVELTILAGLRKLGGIIEQESKQMPILDDIMDHEVLGRELKRGLELGRAEGYQREQAIIERQVGRRFGPLPLWAKERLAAMTPSETEEIALRLLEASSIEDLLR